jgi:hypothetical protein
MGTVLSVGATFSIRRKTRCMRGLTPIMFWVIAPRFGVSEDGCASQSPRVAGSSDASSAAFPAEALRAGVAGSAAIPR